MVIGIWMSFMQLTQFFIRNWTRGAVRRASTTTGSRSTSTARSAQDLLHSFWVTLRLHGAVGRAVLAARDGRGGAAADDRSAAAALLRTLFLVPYALPVYAAVITWSFMFQRDTGLVNHVLVDQLHLDRRARRSG